MLMPDLQFVTGFSGANLQKWLRYFMLYSHGPINEKKEGRTLVYYQPIVTTHNMEFSLKKEFTITLGPPMDSDSDSDWTSSSSSSSDSNNKPVHDKLRKDFKFAKRSVENKNGTGEPRGVKHWGKPIRVLLQQLKKVQPVQPYRYIFALS